MFAAKVLADSLYRNSRLTTLELTYPRIIHSEFMTHRLISRNAASSRAIPVAKMLQKVRDEPFVPEHWGRNQSGMQAWTTIDGEDAENAVEIWLQARDAAVEAAERLVAVDIHKQVINRLLEPFSWITVIASATNWSNFFSLRCHPDAEPHIYKMAAIAREQVVKSDPVSLRAGEWHLPLTGFPGDEELSLDQQVRVSAGRCARISYLTHDKKRDVEADLKLHDRLAAVGHWSPFEHQAKAGPYTESGGNFGSGWSQYRKTFRGECR